MCHVTRVSTPPHPRVPLFPPSRWRLHGLLGAAIGHHVIRLPFTKCTHTSSLCKSGYKHTYQSPLFISCTYSLACCLLLSSGLNQRANTNHNNKRHYAAHIRDLSLALSLFLFVRHKAKQSHLKASDLNALTQLAQMTSCHRLIFFMLCLCLLQIEHGLFVKFYDVCS